MIGDLLLGFGIVLVLAVAGVWAGPRLLRGFGGARVRMALLTSRDGRYAVRIADSLQSVASRVRRAVIAMDPDPNEREAVLAMLRQFSGVELNALLWQCRLLLATGDTDRIRELRALLEKESADWARQTDPAARDRAERQMAALRQELESRSQTGRTWALLVTGMEQAQRDLETLERELVVLGVAKHQPITAFRSRIAESVDSLRRLREAHAELERPGT